MTSNPLIDKFYELHPEKKEKPKPDYYNGEKSYAEELKELRDTSTIPIKKLTSYDVDSSRDSFLQVAEQIKNGEAKVSSMSMQIDIMYGTTITFEVQVWDT